MINLWLKAAGWVALAAGGNVFLAVLTVFLFYIPFSMIEAMVEKMIWGDRFEHWLDPLFMLAFMSFACTVVWACAQYNFKQ